MLAVPLTFLNPIFAILGAGMCVFASYYLFDLISRALFSKEFQPPSRHSSEWDATRRASDWFLSIPFLLVFVLFLFAFGEIGDCLGGRDVWKSGWQLCKRPED